MTGSQKATIAASVLIAFGAGVAVGWLARAPEPAPSAAATPQPDLVKAATKGVRAAAPAVAATPRPAAKPAAAVPAAVPAAPSTPSQSAAGATPDAPGAQGAPPSADGSAAPPPGSAPVANDAGGSAGSDAGTPKTLNRETILEGISTMKPAVKACYEELLKEFPEADGRVVLGFTIVGDDGEGRIDLEKINEEQSTLFDKRMHGCVLDGLREVTFPAPTDGEMQVSYPFKFSNAGATPAE